MKSKLGILFQVLVFLSIIVVFLYGFQSTDQGLNKEDTQRAKEAIRKAAIECYSIEGAYPENLDYLKTHYGLIIQEDKYLIRYHFIASNIMPDTDVFWRGD